MVKLLISMDKTGTNCDCNFLDCTCELKFLKGGIWIPHWKHLVDEKEKTLPYNCI